MGTFTSVSLYDRGSTRPVSGRTVRVTSWLDGGPVATDPAVLTTDYYGATPEFTVDGVDVVRVSAGSSQVRVLVSVEKQMDAAPELPTSATDGQVLTWDAGAGAWVARSDTSGSGVDIQVGGTQPASGWWLDTGQPIPGIPVTPTGPTWTDDEENGGGTWTTPTETGITYSPASGTATSNQTVTVTAHAQTGYELQGQTSWTHTFPEAPPAPPVIHDQFNRTVASGLGTADSGQAWVTTGTWSVDGANAVLTSNSSSALIDAGTHNLDATLEIVSVDGSSSAAAGLYLNYLDGDNFDLIRLNPSDSAMQLMKRRGGTSSFPSFGTVPSLTGTLRVTCTHAAGQFSYQAWHDGVQIGGTQTATETTGTQVGMGTWTGGAPTGAGWKFGSITVEAL